MNDRSSDSDGLGSTTPGRGANDDSGPDEGFEAAADERRSLEDRWQRFLSGQADEERRRRLERRRVRLQGEEVSHEAPEPSGPETPPAGREKEPVVGPAEEPEPRTRAEELRSLERARAEDPEPGAPVVVPAKEKADLPFWRRRWKAIAAVAALLLVAFFLFRGGIGGAGDGTSADAGAASAEIGGADGIDPERVGALADSLETAIGQYRERKRDFDLNRLGCEGLARGYETVRSALGELRSAVPYADDLPEGPLRTRYLSLASSVDSVEQGFDATGCGEAP